MEELKIRVSNIHCRDCETSIGKSLSHLGIKTRISTDDEIVSDSLQSHPVFKISDNDISIYGFGLEQKRIVKVIAKAGFKVLSWDLVKQGSTEIPIDEFIGEDNLEHDGNHLDTHIVLSNLFNWWSSYQRAKQDRHHMRNCRKCKEEEAEKAKERELQKAKNLDDAETFGSDAETAVGGPPVVVGSQNKEYRVVLTVDGMTCASCVSAVEEQIQKVFEDANLDVENSKSGGGIGGVGDGRNFSVSLLSHSAVIILPNKHLINKIIDTIEDCGFDCRLIEALPIERSVNSKLTAAIGGITCSACAVAIQGVVKDLPFILDSGINVVSKTGTFVMEDGADNVNKLKDTIEEIGYDFETLSIQPINYSSAKKKSRTINVSVDGMFCGHCPDIITNYLSSFGEAIVIEDPITINHPFIRFTYLPNPDSKITVRRFLDDIDHLVSDSNEEDGYMIKSKSEGKGPFKSSLIEPVSTDEHLRKLGHREVMKIVRRLIIATAFVIPTFIFGVVSMSLLPKKNHFRKWVEEPIWAGNVARNTWILFILSTPVYVFAADIFHVKAIMELKSLWFNKNPYYRRFFKFGSMNLLTSLGTSVAYFASIALLILASQQKPSSKMGVETTYFDSVVFLTFFLLIGRLLESYSKSRTADAISNLSKLKIKQAHLVVEDDDENDASGLVGKDGIVDVKYLEVGDLIRIVPGDSPPVDCTIIEGVSEFDESALTGESKAVKHGPGHQIFSGTINAGNAVITAKIISLEGDSLIDQIVNTVRDGQLRKAPIARTADILTSYFVPVITLLAVITWVVWLSLGYSGRLPEHYLDIDIGGWAVWSLEFSIAVFVIACPCGIGLAAPTALFVGSGLAAKYGILAKGGGVAFQDGANTNVVCFDKTGTLTYGEMKVTDYSFLGKSEELKLVSLQVTKDLELASKHPIAKAVKDFLSSKHGFENIGSSPSKNKIPQVVSIPGKGLRGEIILDDDGSAKSRNAVWQKIGSNSECILGNEKLMDEYNVVVSAKQKDLFTKWKQESKSIVLVSVKSSSYFGDDKFHLTFALGCRDQIRAETKTVISYLQKNNIECYMITGDNKLTAEAIGKEINIAPENIISEVLPDDKQFQVQRIQKIPGKTNKVVAMVGDGINDAPALASADVGIALSSGADLAVTSSDFIILNKTNPLVTLVTLFDLSRAVFKRVYFNFGWSLVYNVIGIPIAAGVIYPYHNSRLNPVWASAAMALSSISVVTSSLALRLYRPKIKEIKEINTEEEAPREAVL